MSAALESLLQPRPLGDTRVQTEGRKAVVHVYVPAPEPTPSRTLCGKVVSGLVWWRGMPVTSDPPAFTEEPAVSCPACLTALEEAAR